MLKRICLIVMLISVFVLPLNARRIGGVYLPEKITYGGQKMVLNGGGIRVKFFMNIYVAGLYLKKKNHNASQIIYANKPMAIRLKITSGLVTPARFVESTMAGFKRSTGGNIGPIRSQINSFIAVFKSGVKKGDLYDIVYFPGKGTYVYKNGSFKTVTRGYALKKALFGIWICRNPAHGNPKLRKGLLGY